MDNNHAFFKTFSISLTIVLLACSSPERNIFLGMGAKTGEITAESAVVYVRLTQTAGQDEAGLLPGKEGQVRIIYAPDSLLTNATHTSWLETIKVNDYSVQFHLRDLRASCLYYFRVEMRETAQAGVYQTDLFSFRTAPAASVRESVTFQVTTGQDRLGTGTYRNMAANHTVWAAD